MTDAKSCRWKYLTAGSAALLFSGVIYAWSILKAPFATDMGWTAAQLGFNYTLTISVFCLSSVVCGVLSTKLPFRIRILMGAVMVFLGFFITSRMSGNSIITLYLGYGLLAGAGIGFTYNCIITTVSSWYPDKKGFCSGVLLMCFGGSTLVVGKISGILMEMESVGWRTTYLFIAVLTAAVIVVASLIIKVPGKDVILPEPAKEKRNDAPIDENLSEVTGLALIKRPSFLKMYILFVCTGMLGSTAISFAKDITMFVGAGEALAVTIVGVISVSNGLGRIILGCMFDAAGLRKTQYFMAVMSVIAPVTTLIGILNTSIVTGVAGLCLCAMVYGFAPTMSASMMLYFYGPKHYPLNFSLLNTVLFPSSFAATITGITVTNTGGYTIAAIMICVCGAIAALMNLLVKRP